MVMKPHNRHWRISKALCIKWWDKNAKKDPKEWSLSKAGFVHPMDWIQSTAAAFDSRFTWDWFGKCITRDGQLTVLIRYNDYDKERDPIACFGAHNQNKQLEGLGVRAAGSYAMVLGGVFSDG